MSKQSKHERREREAAAAAEAAEAEAAKQRRSRKRWKIIAGVMVVLAAISMGVLASLLIGAGNSVPAKDVLACIPNRDYTKSSPSGGSSGVAGGAHPTDAKCPPKGAPHVDGLIQDVTDNGFDLITIDGDRRSYKVRSADRPYIDIQHAQTHANIGQPVRIYTKDVEGEEVIIYMIDSKLQF
jgi:hypothetical protein